MTTLSPELLTPARVEGLARAAAAFSTEEAPYTPDSYLDFVLARMLDSYAAQYSVGSVPASQWVLRFTATEYAAITQSADPDVQGLIGLLKQYSNVNVFDQTTVGGVNALAAKGLIAPERVAALLAL